MMMDDDKKTLKDKRKEYYARPDIKLKHSEYMKSYYKKNKEFLLEKQKEYYKSNKEKIKEYMREYMKHYNKSDKRVNPEG